MPLTNVIIGLIVCAVLLYLIILEYIHKKKAKKEHLKIIAENIISDLGDTDYITKFMALANAGYTGKEIVEIIGECP